MEHLLVDLECSHQVAISVPAMATNGGIRETVRLIDQTVADYKWGFKPCARCLPLPIRPQLRAPLAA